MCVQSLYELDDNRLLRHDVASRILLEKIASCKHGIVFVPLFPINQGLERFIDARHILVSSGIRAHVWMVLSRKSSVGFAKRLRFSGRSDAQDLVEGSKSLQFLFETKIVAQSR